MEELGTMACGGHGVGLFYEGEFLSLVSSPVLFGSLSFSCSEALAGIELEA